MAGLTPTDGTRGGRQTNLSTASVTQTDRGTLNLVLVTAVRTVRAAVTDLAELDTLARATPVLVLTALRSLENNKKN